MKASKFTIGDTLKPKCGCYLEYSPYYSAVGVVVEIIRSTKHGDELKYPLYILQMISDHKNINGNLVGFYEHALTKEI